MFEIICSVVLVLVISFTGVFGVAMLVWGILAAVKNIIEAYREIKDEKHEQ